ncbi:hypothetical protein GOV10_02210, partial [Candidatus Woesearchaeota archaeon]|nr:hypothetical protein [Candidatus Woesearchaeota archaeon]
GPLIMIVLLVLMVWIWVVIVPTAVTPNISSTLSATASSEHSDGVGFFLRMIPWAVPAIFIVGLIWLGVSGR